MAMPLRNIRINVRKGDPYSPVCIYDGDRFLLEVGDRNGHLQEDELRAHNEDIRIAELIAELLGNHGANDDTSSLYDELID